MADDAHNDEQDSATPLIQQFDGQLTEQFIYLSLTGERFDPVGMPADATVELKAVRDALYELARQAWLDQHQGRSRVPTGFGAMFDLRLISIGKGSARPVLQLQMQGIDARSDADDLLPAVHAGRVRMIEALEGVRENAALPKSLRAPVQAASVLAKLGRSLGENESIEIGLPQHAISDSTPITSVVVDAQVRQTLQTIERALSENPEPEHVKIEGIVTEFDSQTRSFHLKSDQGVILCKISAGDLTVARQVKEALAEDGVTAPDVAVSGWAVRESSGRVRLISEVYDLTPVRSIEGKVLMARLEAIEVLEDGWLGPHSFAVSRGVLEAVRPLIERLGALRAVPACGPRPDGSLALEVEVAGRYLTAVVEDDGHRMFLCTDDPETDDLNEIEVPFDPDRLVSFIANGVIDV